jgi:fructokinase
MGDIDAQAGAFIELHRLDGLVVTLGNKGAIALTEDGDRARVLPSQTLEVVDTVGAGDAFTSVLITGLSLDWPLDQILQRAQDFASMLVERQGATVHDRNFYQTMTTDWGL